MSKISDKLREFIDEGDLYPRYIAELRRIADRIDAEMVELPKDRDGVPINLGDEVCLDGKCGHVTRIDYRIDNEHCVTFWSGRECIVCMETELAELTHKRHDSLECIADELDEMVDASDSSDDRCEKLADLADRIRKLAEKEDK